MPRECLKRLAIIEEWRTVLRSTQHQSVSLKLEARVHPQSKVRLYAGWQLHPQAKARREQ